MKIHQSSGLMHDLDMNIKDSDFTRQTETFDHDLQIIEVGAICGDINDMSMADYLNQDFSPYPADHSDLYITPIQRSERRPMTTHDIQLILNTLFNAADDRMKGVSSISIDIEHGSIIFDGLPDDCADGGIHIDVQSGHCVSCGGDLNLDPVEALQSVSESIGSINEQITMLENERTRLSYIRDDMKQDLIEQLDV